MAAALERMWPILTPQQLLHDLFGAAPLIELAAARLLDPAERRLLERPRLAHVGDVRMDRGRHRLCSTRPARCSARRRRRAVTDAEPAPRTFGHVVVDEAQDLSPMQLRMVARRSLSGSMTVVGDLAQATGTLGAGFVVAGGGASSGPTRLASGGAHRQLPHAPRDHGDGGPDTRTGGARASGPPRRSGSSGRPPRIIRADRSAGSFPGDALGAVTARAVRRSLMTFQSGQDGTVAIIVPPSLLDPVAPALAAAGINFGQVGERALDERVTLLTIEDAKGLEFDAVTVVEPARIVPETRQGLRALYVAFTRATQMLSIVHADALPATVARPCRRRPDPSAPARAAGWTGPGRRGPGRGGLGGGGPIGASGRPAP